MRKYNNILELRDHAIYLYPGIEAYIPDENRREELPLEGIRDLYDHNYSRKDGIICFVYAETDLRNSRKLEYNRSFAERRL